jgi:hypothetical protein
MAIVYSQLVASKVLLQSLVDKDTGLPLAAGIINLYKDDNRLIRKNWYYKTGTPGSYTYAALPNPMTLNGAGAIVDSLGNEVTPYYYPFDEDNSATSQLYYVTVYNSAATLQFTQQGFPPINRSEGVGEQATLQNLIVNNQFWNQNVQSNSSQSADAEVTVNCTNETSIAICPSNHDGYSMPDIRFMKDVTGANDTIIFKRYPNTDPLLTGNVTPQFYINISCTSVAVEGYKFIQFPICLNTRNLEQEPFIFTVQTQLPSGAPARTISARILKYLGSANTVALGGTIGTGTISPTASWTKATLTDTFPTLSSSDVISPTEDDAFYLQLSLPVNSAYNFNIAVPSLYLGTLAATNDFQSYDKIDSITNSPRTGDYRTSINRYMLGWVPSNDGTIGQRGSAATTRANTDCWPLYKLLYENILDTWAPVSGGRAAPANTAYGAFTNNRTIGLTKNLGRVLTGLNPLFTSSVFTAVAGTRDFTTNFGVNNALTLGSSYAYTAGTPVQVFSSGTLPAGLTAGTVYYISSSPAPAATVVYLSATYNQAIAGNNIALTSNGVGTHSITTTCVITLTTSQNPTLTVGTPVQVSNSGGALPAPLVVGRVYYVSTLSLTTNTVVLAETLTDAFAGVAYPITTNGTGTNTVSTALGAFEGASYTRDVASHAHPFSSDATFLKSPATSNFSTAAGGTQDAAKVTGTTDYVGTSQVSIMQPHTSLNVFIKL